jgi:hypothetical protein
MVSSPNLNFPHTEPPPPNCSRTQLFHPRRDTHFSGNICWRCGRALTKQIQEAEEIAGDFARQTSSLTSNVLVMWDRKKAPSRNQWCCANEDKRARHAGKSLALPGEWTGPCIESAVHLGHTTTSTLSDTPHLRLRTPKAAQVFGALGRNLMRSNRVWKKEKTLLDGIECCVLTHQALGELKKTAYHRMVRALLHVPPCTQRKW